MIHKELILILIWIEITKINKEKTISANSDPKINNKSPLTVYNYTKILNKYESTLNYYWIKQILYYT